MLIKLIISLGIAGYFYYVSGEILISVIIGLVLLFILSKIFKGKKNYKPYWKN